MSIIDMSLVDRMNRIMHARVCVCLFTCPRDTFSSRFSFRLLVLLFQMYSDASDFYDEDEDISWSSMQTINANRNDTSTLGPVREFGDFVDTHGWVQCHSKSYPNRVYFHNMHSNCDTWYRPLSRYVDIPFVSVKRVCHTDDTSENNIELLSVSDNENERSIPADKSDESLTKVPDVIARYYYTPQVDLTYDADDSCRSSDDAFARECHYEKEQFDQNNNVDEDIADEKSDSDTGCCAANFLETEFFVGEDEIKPDEEINRIFNSSMNDDISSVTTQSPPSSPCFDVPRLKKVGLEDLLTKERAYNRVERGPRKIICDMYGVRTINYDLPMGQMRPEVAVKSSTLSESDSDVSEPSSPNAKPTQSFVEFDWCDIEKDLYQPLLSDPSSSPSSRSDTSSSTAYSTCSSCSTCSNCSTCT